MTVAGISLKHPIAVFDAGIGSYSAVRVLREHYPRQDILYFADRASFPYGEKSIDDLRATIERTLRYLCQRGASAIVLASNAPSVTVLDELKSIVPVPVIGVLPPVRQAVSETDRGHVAVLGAHSMTSSVALQKFIQREAGDRAHLVRAYDASPLIELVESGQFMAEPAETQAAVDQYMTDMLKQDPLIRSVTLSSTHLPWLLAFLATSRPDIRYYDPIESILSDIHAATSEGSGATVGLVSECARYPKSEFREMLLRLGIDIPFEMV